MFCADKAPENHCINVWEECSQTVLTQRKTFHYFSIGFNGKSVFRDFHFQGFPRNSIVKVSESADNGLHKREGNECENAF